MNKRILLLIAFLLTACTCQNKDPQAVLPGWRDNTLEFGQHHDIIVMLGEDGNYYPFFDADPGNYTVPSYIENVWWCDK